MAPEVGGFPRPARAGRPPRSLEPAQRPVPARAAPAGPGRRLLGGREELGPSLSSSRGLTLGVAPRAKLGAKPASGALKSHFTGFGEMNFSFYARPGSGSAAALCVPKTNIPPPERHGSRDVQEDFIVPRQTEMNCSRREGRKKGGVGGEQHPPPRCLPSVLAHTLGSGRPGQSWREPRAHGKSWPRLCWSGRTRSLGVAGLNKSVKCAHCLGHSESFQRKIRTGEKLLLLLKCQTGEKCDCGLSFSKRTS